VYAHIFVTQLQRPINPADPAFISDAVVYHRHGNTAFHSLSCFLFVNIFIYLFTLALTKFYPQRSIVKQKNLLKGKSGEEEEESVHVEEKIEEKIKEKVEEPVEVWLYGNKIIKKELDPYLLCFIG
jgi:hypothetical protein